MHSKYMGSFEMVVGELGYVSRRKEKCAQINNYSFATSAKNVYQNHGTGFKGNQNLYIWIEALNFRNDVSV